MLLALREALSRHTVRLAGSRFAKPAARVVVGAGGLIVLALVGHSASGSMGHVSAQSLPASAHSTVPLSTVPSELAAGAMGSAVPVLSPIPVPASPARASTEAAAGRSPPRSPATSDDPVMLNTASFEDLRRLPGIGDKRANAILVLRMHLGRFRTVEDLLKVKGIGRAMLRRLRPLVRLDPASSPDAGRGEPRAGA
jgi:competence protein ComEA